MLQFANASGRAALAALLMSCAACSDETATPKGAGAPTTVAVETATASAMQIAVQATGTVETSATVSVTSLVSGQLKAVQFNEGDHVAVGQTLFQIDDSELQAQIEAANAKQASDEATAAELQREYLRIKALLDKGFETKADVEKARSDADTAAEIAKSDAANVGVLQAELVHYTITAPIEGRTGESLIQPGATIAANTTPLVTINRISPVRVRFAIPAIQVAIARAQFEKSSAKVTVSPHGAQTAPAEGKLVFLDNAVNSTNGELLAKGEFANADETLLPGELVDVTLDLGSAGDLVSLPEEAVRIGGDKPYAYVADGKIARRRAVEIAGRAGGRVYLASGIAAGEQVIVDGLSSLSDGAAIRIATPPGTGANAGAPQ